VSSFKAVLQVSDFSGFDPTSGQVDKFFHDRLANNPSYTKLWAVVKIVNLSCCCLMDKQRLNEVFQSTKKLKVISSRKTLSGQEE